MICEYVRQSRRNLKNADDNFEFFSLPKIALRLIEMSLLFSLCALCE
jgi:hypothetical protein